MTPSLLFLKTWFPSLPGELRWRKRGSGHAAPKDEQANLCHTHFPSTMTTETTVSKGQEFFSPGQTEGDMCVRVQGGINWERCNVNVVVDTTEMDNVRYSYEEFLSPADCNSSWTWEKETQKRKEGVLQRKLLSCLNIRRICSLAVRQYPLLTEMKKDIDWYRRPMLPSSTFLQQISHMKD